MDGEVDCLDGMDEDVDKWLKCGTDYFTRYQELETKCEEVLLCPSERNYIDLTKLCDRINTCSFEEKLCKAARQTEIDPTNLVDTFNSRPGGHFIQHCFPEGASDLEMKLGNCSTVEHTAGFVKTVLNVQQPVFVSIPETKVDCSYLFARILFLKLRPQFPNMGYVKTSGTALAAATCLLAVYVEMSARFGIPIAMIGGMLKKNCTVGEELCWSEQTKANVLGAYFYGYTAMFFSVSFVKKFNIFLSGYRSWLVLCIVAQFTYPILAQLSTGGLMVAQAVRGFMTGIMITYNMEFINNWIPLRYKKSLISAIGFINYLGNGTAGLIASAFTSNIGWEYYFYFCGAMFSLVLLLNLIFVATFPKDSFFLKTCGQEVDTVQRQEQKQPVTFSFRDILSRWYVWMFCVYGISYNLTYYHTLVTSPFYLNEVLQVDAQTISLITLGLSLTVAFSTIFFSWFFQWLDTYISWRTCRMLFIIVPMVIQIIVFLVFPWIETTGAATFLLILSTLAASTFFSGSVITANMEIDPENAAVVLSLFNGAAQIAGFLGPILMAVFTDIEDKKEGWDKFFYAMAGCAAVGIVSIVFAVWVKPSEWKNRSKLGEPFRDNEMLNTCRLDQQGMLPGLATPIKSSLKFSLPRRDNLM
eukprot:sb/3462915/